MENIVFTQLSIPEVRAIFRQELQTFFESNQSKTTQPEADELLTVQQAAEFLTLSVPTLYSLISRGEVPVMKRSKRCYFLKQDLINYLKEGRKKSPAEIGTEASQYINQKKRGLK